MSRRSFLYIPVLSLFWVIGLPSFMSGTLDPRGGFIFLADLLPVVQILIPVFLVILGFLLGLIFEHNRLSLKKELLLDDASIVAAEAQSESEPEPESTTSEEELRLLNATKDKFFSIIAHDLKNPFNSLLGFSELLKNDFESYNTEEVKRFIGIIYESSKHGFDLLENLLQWSRSQTGRIAFLPDLVSLRDIINGSVDLLKSSADNKEIKIYNELKDELEVFGDIEMLSTVFRNLISNAIKFTPRNGRIKIKSKRNSKTVEVSVIDTGVGISEEKIPDLFRIDRQVSTFGTANEKGTGLGLILCKEFIDKHKGRIKVTSERKNGSEFKVILPAQNRKQDGNAGYNKKTKAFEKGEFAAHP